MIQLTIMGWRIEDFLLYIDGVRHDVSHQFFHSNTRLAIFTVIVFLQFFYFRILYIIRLSLILLICSGILHSSFSGYLLFWSHVEILFEEPTGLDTLILCPFPRGNPAVLLLLESLLNARAKFVLPLPLPLLHMQLLVGAGPLQDLFIEDLLLVSHGVAALL